MAAMLNDRYELGDVVGSGGMGAVHRATDHRLGRTVAVKILRGGPLADGSARSRMRSEANLAASINHPGVAQVFDFHDGTGADDAGTFIVMQFVEGHTLAQLLREGGPMSVEQVMSVVVQVAEGLQAAHDAGIVHRDLKPANIMLTPAGRTVLVDFGIAHSASSEPLTSTGSLIGTAEYMSPEQAAGRRATPRSDLYSLGVVAHHCLTGTSPFRRDSPIATALAQLNDDLPPLGPRVPADVVGLIASLTAKNPADRPTSAAAVALRAAAIGADEAIDLPTTFELPAPHAASTEPFRAETAVVPFEAVPPVGRRPRRGRPMAAYAALGTVLVATVLLGVGRLQPGDDPVVPGVVGMSVDDATAQLRDADLAASPTMVDQTGQPAGQVVAQDPPAGDTPPGDGPVRLSVASGKVAVSAADLVGLSWTDASAALEKLGLEVARLDVTQSADVGTVVALDASGRLAEGSLVTLSVAVAPTTAPAPDIQTSVPAASSGPTARQESSGKGRTKTRTKGKAKGKGKG